VSLELRHYTDVEPVQKVIVDIHVEVGQRDFGLIGEQQPFRRLPVFAAMMRDPLHRV
jgi:hypothetical protein